MKRSGWKVGCDWIEGYVNVVVTGLEKGWEWVKKRWMERRKEGGE